MALVASVAYTHDHSPVIQDDKSFLVEPPLFTTFNGVEYPAHHHPTRLEAGKASFKLAISLLSSKCDNRLFSICFTPQPPPDPPICAPCFSKPIRSISRKRTHAPHLTLPPAQLVDPLPSSPPRVKVPNPVADSSSMLNSPVASSSDDERAAMPRNAAHHVKKSERSSSGTSTQHFSSSAMERAAQFLQESLSTQGSRSILSHSTAERFADSDTRSSVDHLLPMSHAHDSPQQWNPGNLFFDRNALAMRMSPSPESGSPTSAILTSESCADNKESNPMIQSSPLVRPVSAPSAPVSRPFRPHASIGVCRLPFSNLQPGFSFPTPGKRFSEDRLSPCSLLEGVHQLFSAAALRSPAKQRVDSILQGFALEACSEAKSTSGRSDMNLEEEERALHYLELSLQEVNREIQRKKEEVRIKRRRLMEDEARLHNIFHQSSSWIESLSSKLSH